MSERFPVNRPEIRDQITEEEWNTRVDLAAAYRAAALYGWDDLLFSHMSARVPGQADQLLLNPLNRTFEEITASTLHKLDSKGKHVLPVSDDPEQWFAFQFHASIYRAFPQAQCVIHLHTRAATAVSMQADGLLPSNQYAMWTGPVGYHDYEGLISTPEEGKRLAQNFKGGKVVIQRGHGFIVWDISIPRAFIRTYVLERACECQVLAGHSNLYRPPQSVIDQTAVQALNILESDTDPIGPLNWGAVRRRLDRLAPEYKT